jgi:hypothetical protein
MTARFIFADFTQMLTVQFALRLLELLKIWQISESSYARDSPCIFLMANSEP